MKRELFSEAFKKLARYFLLNVLKLAGWQVYLILKVLDVLLISLVFPFIKAEVSSYKMKHISKKQKKLFKHIGKTVTEDNFNQKIKDAWQIIKKEE